MANLPHGSSLFFQNNGPCIYSPPNPDEVSSPPRRYNCTVCSRSFRRREHFERHLASHSKSRDFRCDLCGKRFGRKDTLQRHSTLHRQVPLTKVQKTLPRAPCACLNCVKSKQRCSGSHPCDRCNRKGWPCQFTKGSKERPPQGQEIFPNEIERRTSNHPNRTLVNNRPVEPSVACGLSPISTITPGPSGPDSVNIAGGQCVDSPFSSLARQTSQHPEANLLFDSFLLWPINDAFGNSDIVSTDPSSLQTLSEMAGTMDQPLNISLEGESPAELSNFQRERPRYAADTPISPDGQLANYVSENALTEEDRDILMSENYGHLPKPSISTYERIRAHYAEMKLYFEHFHQQFPILHKSTFEARGPSWLLYIAVAAVGSQYSRLPSRSRIFCDLVNAIRVSLLRKLSSTVSLQNNLELAQATLLFNFALLFHGRRESLMHLQYQRSLLVTMCRPLLTPGILFAKRGMLSNAAVSTDSWTQWIAVESWKRLVYFTWLVECLQLIFYDIPPILTVDDMHLSMPCNDELWQSASFHDWERAQGLQRDPTECLSVISLLNMRDINQECIRSLGDSALWISVFAVYVADRRSTEHNSLYHSSTMHRASEYGKLPSVGGVVAYKYDRDPVDSILEGFQQAVTQHRKESPLVPIVAKFSLVLRLLRFAQYRLLYVSSGWMAQPQEVDAAAQHIAQLLQTEPQRARQSLLHAAQLFRIIRSQRQFEPHDSIILLMAVLYIWNYDRFAISDKSRFPSGGDAEILRIDQSMDEDLQKKWIAGTFETPKQVHISGLGVLNGRDSVPRIFRESVRILSHEKAWSGLANAIKHALHQIVLGGAPSFPAEAE